MSDNFKVLGIGLIVLGTLSAGLVLAQMWFTPFAPDFFVRILVTLGVCGLYGIYVGMIWDDIEKSRYRNMLLSLAGFGLIAVILVLVQTWAEAFAWGTFIKLMVSVVVLSGLVSFIMAIREDFLEGKRLKDQDFLD
jgi:MFS family permease